MITLFYFELRVSAGMIENLKTRDITLIPGGGGVLPEKLGGGVRPASQNPYPIYDQNLRYSLPYL